MLLLFTGAAQAADVTLMIPDDKARNLMILPTLIERCQQDVAYRGDINACLIARNLIADLAQKLKNELDAQAAEKK